MEILIIIFAYLLGGVPFGLLVGKLVKGIDIRDHGSKNLGATNAVRVLGKPLGIGVFILDFLKGAVPVWVAQNAGLAIGAVCLAGLISIMGHVFPIYLKFKGGKGVATSAGALLAIAPKVLGTAFLGWLVIFLVSRMVSLASILASLLALVLTILWVEDPFGMNWPVTALISTLFILIVVRHRSNIGRIIRGEENKFAKKNDDKK